MAKRQRRSRSDAAESDAKKGDLQALGDHARENPGLYTVAVVFIVLCGVGGALYRVYQGSAENETATEYARAIDIEDPAERALALKGTSEQKSSLQDEILYMSGEAAFGADQHQEAAEAFEKLQRDFPNSVFAPAAVEGLGYVAEDKKDYAGALARYQEVLDKWPESFVGRRQPGNIGRCQEKNGDFEAAKLAYTDQQDIFPGSREALNAQRALDLLERDHPDLFAQTPEAVAGETAAAEVSLEAGTLEDVVVSDGGGEIVDAAQGVQPDDADPVPDQEEPGETAPGS